MAIVEFVAKQDVSTADDHNVASIDARVADALLRIDSTQTEIENYLKNHNPQEVEHKETASNEWKSLGDVFTGIGIAVGDFFAHLFGATEPALHPPDSKVAQLADQLGLQVDELRQLQAIRHSAIETGHRVTLASPEATRHPDLYEHIHAVHGGLHSVTDLLTALHERISDSQPHQEHERSESTLTEYSERAQNLLRDTQVKATMLEGPAAPQPNPGSNVTALGDHHDEKVNVAAPAQPMAEVAALDRVASDDEDVVNNRD